MKKNLLLFLLFLVSGFATANDIVGSWYGKADFGVMSLRIVFNIESDGENYTATMQSPDQSEQLIPVESVTFQDSILVLTVPAIKLSYEGVVRNDSLIEGSITQMGQKFPLNLSREAITVNRLQEPRPPYPYQIEEVTFKNTKADITLAGTLTLPPLQVGQKFPGVILVKGSGAHNRDQEMSGHKPFLVIADYLTRHGIAVLRYDDRGVGQSEGNHEASTTFDFADDAEAAFNLLRSREEIDPNRLGIIGHSEGGTIAFILGSKLEDLSFIVSLAGTGVKGDQLLLKQLEDVYLSMGASSAVCEAAVADCKKTFKILEDNDDTSIIKDNLSELFIGKVLSDSEIEEHVQAFTTPWMINFVKYDPQENLQNIHCPVFALNGDKDIQVNADMNLDAIRKNIEADGNKNVTVKKYPGLNHLFQKCKTCSVIEYGELEETFNVEPLKDMKDWILNLK